jgi:hypothetical protein
MAEAKSRTGAENLFVFYYIPQEMVLILWCIPMFRQRKAPNDEQLAD